MNASVEQWLAALRWVMTQPGLLTGLAGGTAPLLEEDDPRLGQMLDRTGRDPSGLLELLAAPRSHKVGIAFEALVHWGIECGLGHTVLGRDVQIQSERRTVGALDVVLRRDDGIVEHWELAYKLFLQSRPAVEWSSWLGPGERDRLDTKVNRMRNHQSPLSGRAVAKPALEALGVINEPVRRVVLQGVLFTPWTAPVARAQDARCDAAGRWVREGDLSRVMKQWPESRWVRRLKPLWFGPWVGPPHDICSASERLKHLDEPVRRAQLWSVWGAGQDTEQLWFVVPQQWGSRAR